HGDPGVRSPSATSSDTQSPEFLAGRYRLDRLIAEGGTAQVWRGFDLELQRHVAVKVPRPERFTAPQQAEWFPAEARRVAQLRHPRILPVYDVVWHEKGCCL